MNQKQMERQRRINSIVSLLEQVPKDSELDERTFIMELCIEYNVSSRKAKEYLSIAQHYYNHANKTVQKRSKV